jgi:hypothetical protein
MDYLKYSTIVSQRIHLVYKHIYYIILHLFTHCVTSKGASNSLELQVRAVNLVSAYKSFW